MLSTQILATEPVIGLVDPVRTASALVDEVLERRLPCVIINSGLLEPLGERAGCQSINYQGNIEILANELKTMGVTKLIAGCDPVILFTDKLAATMEVPLNIYELSEARRDKGAMGKAMRRAGLRTPHEIQSDKFSEIHEWLQKKSMPVVIKPSDSGGTDDVYKCETIEEVESRFKSIIGKTNLMGSRNNAVLVQEYIDGIEYVVDSVSFDGVHVFTDVLQYEKGSHNGRSFVYEKIRFLKAETPISQKLMVFASKALDALGFKVGGAHMELKINSSGEVVFLEAGARLAGANIHTMVLNGRNDNQSQVQLIIDATLGKSAPKGPFPSVNGSVKVFIITEQEGLISGFRNIEKIKALASFRDLELHTKIGERLVKSTDLAHNVGMVDLAHIDPVILEQDEAILKDILANGLFELSVGDL